MRAVTVIVIHRASGESHLTFVRLHAVRPPREEQCRFTTGEDEGNEHGGVFQIRASNNSAPSAPLIPPHDGPYVFD